MSVNDQPLCFIQHRRQDTRLTDRNVREQLEHTQSIGLQQPQVVIATSRSKILTNLDIDVAVGVRLDRLVVQVAGRQKQLDQVAAPLRR